MEFLAQLHPAVVHFAIALVITGILFDLVGFITGKSSLKSAGFWNIILAVIFVWGASITGHEAEELVEHYIKETDAYKLLETHEEIGEILPYLITLLAGFRLIIETKFKNSKKILLGYIIVGIIFAGLIGYQGRTGGKLVYDYGIGTVKTIKIIK